MPTEITAPAAARLTAACVAYDGRDVLHDVDLVVRRGEFAVIAGPNGAGKSTLLEAVAGTTPLRSGERMLHAAVAFVPQRAAVSARLPVSVRDVVTVGTWGRGERRPPRAEMRARVDLALARLDIAALASRSFATLSGGQQQRTLLAQGLARAADLLLLDEPTTGLDADSGRRIRSVLREEAARGAAVVCVSHDAAVLDDADRVIRVLDGRVVTVA